MGIGSGIFLIALGAILAFAIRADVWWLDVHTVGWVLILAGATILFSVLWFWNDRRRRARTVIVEENKLAHPAQVCPPPAEPPTPPC
ncbi:hypothetical protein SAMN05444365_1011092 [Micromonospora pattaloongensis]|uniref:DUF6458 domain-containing protein n=1 Tax=Micromonospora pattaloongensis TaxID=405436 RepID=A0A1H3I282_9ACTN|nr:DUF6458 family protein [Micromonospora pattaloongensis]SDY21817.1 hypothetical protein SAMN05444365_1011092 [Micromonospora pattaloongensis]